MDSVTIRELCGNSAVEALELADVGTGCSAGFADEIPGTGMTWPDLDAMASRAISCPVGFVDAMCLGCGCALFVPETDRAGDVLCSECQRVGELFADVEDGDDDPTRPGGSAAMENPAYWSDTAARMGDDVLVATIGNADADPNWMSLSGVQRTAFLDGFTAELLKRLDGRQRLAA